MNLDQFKASLESDARKRCDAQEKTIREYRDLITDKDERIRALSNRCYALTRGAMCAFCGYKHDCPSTSARREQEATHGSATP